ncbi:MAG: hypothetical protein ABIJ41_03280 [Candidatus Omnitrophota bacterium]
MKKRLFLFVIFFLWMTPAINSFAGTTSTMILPVHAARIYGSYITNSARIDGTSASWNLLFSTTQTESATWMFRMPTNYSSALSAKLIYTMASATSGNVDLEVEVMALTVGESDPDTASFDAVNEVSGGTAVPGTAGIIDEISITLTNADSVAANDLVIIRVNRDHDDADDTATGDLELRAFSLEYTTN